MNELHSVRKDGVNDFHRYKYVQAADVVADVRRVLLGHGVVVTASMDQRLVLEGGMATFSMGFNFVNIDDPEDYFYSNVPAAAQDKGDKAVWKAITGAIKYALTTNLMLPSYDDPEADSSVDRAASKPVVKSLDGKKQTPKKASPELIANLKTCIDAATRFDKIDGDKLNAYMVKEYGTDRLSELMEEQADALMVMVKNKMEAA